MKISYFLEETWYQRSALQEKIIFFDTVLDDFLQKGILQKKENNMFKFSFVGIFVNPKTGVDLSIILPKYLDNTILANENQCQDYTRLLIRLFRKYAKKSLNDSYMDQLDVLSENTFFNLIAIIDYLISDYLEYGLYSNDQECYELNGNGTINWEKTIEEKFTVISNRRPIYLDLVTRAEENDENDYIRQIHQNIIYECFSLLEQFSFLEIFEYPSLYITKAKSIIEDVNHQLTSIDLELRNVFSDRKIMLLKAMQYFLKQNMPLTSSETIFFGTKSFHVIWETISSEIFQNQYNEYKECIPKPIWTSNTTASFGKTMIPDIIRRLDQSLIIFDAKYYKLPFNDTGSLLSGHPGVEDVNKQYLYELALRQCDRNIDVMHYYNIFLLPSPGQEIEVIGHVRMPLFNNMNIGPVYLITLPAKDIYNMYIENQYIDIETLQEKILGGIKKGSSIALNEV
jgi:hypothetical protein